MHMKHETNTNHCISQIKFSEYKKNKNRKTWLFSSSVDSVGSVVVMTGIHLFDLMCYSL